MNKINKKIILVIFSFVILGCGEISEKKSDSLSEVKPIQFVHPCKIPQVESIVNSRANRGDRETIRQAPYKNRYAKFSRHYAARLITERFLLSNRQGMHGRIGPNTISRVLEGAPTCRKLYQQCEYGSDSSGCDDFSSIKGAFDTVVLDWNNKSLLSIRNGNGLKLNDTCQDSLNLLSIIPSPQEVSLLNKELEQICQDSKKNAWEKFIGRNTYPKRDYLLDTSLSSMVISERLKNKDYALVAGYCFHIKDEEKRLRFQESRDLYSPWLQSAVGTAVGIASQAVLQPQWAVAADLALAATALSTTSWQLQQLEKRKKNAEAFALGHVGKKCVSDRFQAEYDRLEGLLFNDIVGTGVGLGLSFAIPAAGRHFSALLKSGGAFIKNGKFIVKGLSQEIKLPPLSVFSNIVENIKLPQKTQLRFNSFYKSLVPVVENSLVKIDIDFERFLPKIGDVPYAENLLGYRKSAFGWFASPFEKMHLSSVLEYFDDVLPGYKTFHPGEIIQLDSTKGRIFSNQGGGKGWYLFILDEKGNITVAPNEVIESANHWLAKSLSVSQESLNKKPMELIKHAFLAEENAIQAGKENAGVLLGGEFVFKDGQWYANFRSGRFGHGGGDSFGGTARTADNLAEMIEMLEEMGSIPKGFIKACGVKSFC